uniref:Uncharacterized protein n=1 Tax=Pseudomonas phage Arace01 TaxID=3138526 RepID=A0AAU6VZV7_9VIRU
MPVTEKEIQAITVAPRVTLQDVKDFIIGEHFIQHQTLTICVLTLANGFTVTGESACADLKNFNQEIGQRLAKENATNKIWPLLGFNLKCKIDQIEKAGKPSGKILTLGSPVTYLGTKVIHAVAMTRAEYNKYRGWELPADENGDDNGYLVEYADGGAPNVEGHPGYVSWSPRDVFEKAYGTPVRQTPETLADRIFAEKSWVTEKTLKLSLILNDPEQVAKLDEVELQMMRDQLEHMLDYTNVLIRRYDYTTKG